MIFTTAKTVLDPVAGRLRRARRLRGLRRLLAAGLALPAIAAAQPPVTSPEYLAATHELFYIHAHGGHRGNWLMPYGANANADLTCTDTGTNGERLVHYPLSMPGHLFVQRVLLWGFDQAGVDMLQARLLSVCQVNGGLGAPTANILSTAQSPPQAAGPVLLELPTSMFVSTQSCALTVEVRLAADGQPCIGSPRRITRLRVQAFNPEHIFRDGFMVRQAPTPAVAP